MIRRRIVGIALGVVGVLVLTVVVFLVWAHIVMAGERPASLEPTVDLPALQRVSHTDVGVGQVAQRGVAVAGSPHPGGTRGEPAQAEPRGDRELRRLTGGNEALLKGE